VVPGEAALVAAFLPERDRPFDRFDRFLAVQHDGLAVGLDLLAAPRPQIGVPPPLRVAKGVAGRLAERMALRLQLLAGVAAGVPGLREGLQADLRKPGFAIGNQSAANRPGDPNPLVADSGEGSLHRIIPALLLTDVLGDIG